MADIDFITYLTTNSLEYANFLKQTGEALKSGKNNIHWKCMLSNGAEIVPEGYKCIGNKNTKNYHDSLMHSISINESLKKVTSEYVIIADVDIAITHKNWDDIIVRTLNDYSCFGSPNFKREREGINFPNVPFFCFKKEIMKKIKMDFKPIVENSYKEQVLILRNIDYTEAKMLDRNIGEVIIFDTGCKLRGIFKNARLKSKCLEPINIESEKIQLIFNNKKQKLITKLRCRSHRQQTQFIEYHYNKQVFITHLGISRARYFNNPGTRSWTERITNYLKTKYDIIL